MKRRQRRRRLVVNLFAFALLVWALYLNFAKTDFLDGSLQSATSPNGLVGHAPEKSGTSLKPTTAKPEHK